MNNSGAASQYHRPTDGTTLRWSGLWQNEKIPIAFGESFSALRSYVELANNTESPKQYHLWSLLSLTAAIASNNVWFSHGIAGRLRLNLGVVLIGRPAIRKSSAINFMQRFANDLPLNYGPTDTAGARHGVMSAMQARWQDDVRDESEDESMDLKQLAESNFDHIISKMAGAKTRPASIYFAAKELGRLLTAQTRELLDFFADGLDGEPIYYQTKSGSIRIPAPLINLLGATTPGSLPNVLPRDSHDHGLLSRLIFVYASQSEAAVPIPPHMSKEELIKKSLLLEILNRLLHDVKGELVFDKEAKREYIRLYQYRVQTSEFKLNAYSGRRSDHLAKLASLICLLRNADMSVNKQDVGLAHLILMLTEQDMDAAYAGLDKSLESKAYAMIRETIESYPEEEGTDRSLITAQLIRAGMSNEHIVQHLDRLSNARRINVTAQRITLVNSLSHVKAYAYLESFLT